MENVINVGCNCIVLKEGKVLLGLRKNCYAAGTYGLPGGHLEYNESLIEGAKRELFEESGLEATELELATVQDQPKSNSGSHYIQINFLVKSFTGEPRLTEEDKTESWDWFSLDALPSNMFPPHEAVLENFKNGIRYS